jgi:MFS family permease
MTSPSSSGPRPSVLQVMLRALGHRDYRLFFAAQSISQVGTWMQQMTVVWIAYRLTEDAFLVGVIGFCAQFPTFLLAPVAGVWADRWERRRLLLLTQALAMIQALVLAFLAFNNLLAIWNLALLVGLLGAVNAFDMTASQAFVIDLVRKREDLGSAIALNSAIMNGARLIGPALASLVIHFMNEASCFLVNGLSFLAVLLALAAIHPPSVAAGPARSVPLLHSLGEGARYLYHNRPVRDLLTLLAVVALFGMPYSLLPVYAQQLLHGGPDALGLLMGAGGLGGLFATAQLAARRTIVGAESLLTWTGLGLALSLMLLGAIDVLWLALICRLVVGYCVLQQVTTANTLVQTLVDDDHRGRISSFSTMALLGALPLGNLLAGAVAGIVGVALTFVLTGVGCLGIVLWFWLRLPGFRRETLPVYERMGLAEMEAPDQVSNPGLHAAHH